MSQAVPNASPVSFCCMPVDLSALGRGEKHLASTTVSSGSGVPPAQVHLYIHSSRGINPGDGLRLPLLSELPHQKGV